MNPASLPLYPASFLGREQVRHLGVTFSSTGVQRMPTAGSGRIIRRWQRPAIEYAHVRERQSAQVGW